MSCRLRKKAALMQPGKKYRKCSQYERALFNTREIIVCFLIGWRGTLLLEASSIPFRNFLGPAAAGNHEQKRSPLTLPSAREGRGNLANLFDCGGKGRSIENCSHVS